MCVPWQLKTLKENIARKPTSRRPKNSKAFEIQDKYLDQEVSPTQVSRFR